MANISYYIITGPPFYFRRQTRFNLCILLLLIIRGVEVNPGPSSSVNLTFGMLNTRSVVNKAPLHHNLIADNDLSLLALTKTWIKSDDPPVIKNDPAPPGYRIAHIHRENPDQGRWACSYSPWFNQRLTSKTWLCPHIFRTPTGKHWSQISRYCAI